MAFKSEQENFWAWEFDSYISRNRDDRLAIAARIQSWARILKSINKLPTSVLELGANIGINMDALNILLPAADLRAVEINKDAAEILKAKGHTKVFTQSILDFQSQNSNEFVFTAG